MKALSLILVLAVMWATTTMAQGNMIQENGERRHGPPGMNLTDEQKVCLESKIGKPGDGERPSREAMKAASDECGIQRPEPPQGGRFKGPPTGEQNGYSSQTNVSSSGGVK